MMYEGAERINLNIFDLPSLKIRIRDALRPVELAVAQLSSSIPFQHSSHHLRGFFAHQYPEFSILHNHNSDGTHILGYPQVQYKMLGKNAYIIGLNKGASMIPILTEGLEQITLGTTSYPITRCETNSQTIVVGATRQPLSYQFILPWLALNPSNYKKYKEIYEWKARKAFLNRILVGNCLSLARGLEIFVPFRLFAHTHLDSVEINYKNNRLRGFVGRFKVNFQLPNLIGIGKGVSQGYGTVLLMPNQDVMASDQIIEAL